MNLGEALNVASASTEEANTPRLNNNLRNTNWNDESKLWSNPVELQHSGHLSRSEVRRIQRIVERDRNQFLEEWHDYFSR